MNIKTVFLGIAFVSTLIYSVSSLAEQSHHDMDHSTMSHGDKHETMMEEHAEMQSHDDPPLQADHMTDMPHDDHQTMNHDMQKQHSDMSQQGHDSMMHKDPGSMSHEQGMQHHTDANVAKQAPESLEPLKQMPLSGKAREAGFDNRYAMESTSATNELKAQCAQASRGLIMLDNATFKKCGGKPAGWATGQEMPVSSSSHSGHMDH